MVVTATTFYDIQTSLGGGEREYFYIKILYIKCSFSYQLEHNTLYYKKAYRRFLYRFF